MLKTLALLLLIAMSTEAADYQILGKRFRIQDRGTPARRTIIVYGAEHATDVPRPITLPGEVRLVVNGTTPSDDTFDNIESFWGVTPTGYRYSESPPTFYPGQEGRTQVDAGGPFRTRPRSF
jgi:hypothetical protein